MEPAFHRQHINGGRASVRPHAIRVRRPRFARFPARVERQIGALVNLPVLSFHHHPFLCRVNVAAARLLLVLEYLAFISGFPFVTQTQTGAAISRKSPHEIRLVIHRRLRRHRRRRRFRRHLPTYFPFTADTTATAASIGFPRSFPKQKHGFGGRFTVARATKHVPFMVERQRPRAPRRTARRDGQVRVFQTERVGLRGADLHPVVEAVLHRHPMHALYLTAERPPEFAASLLERTKIAAATQTKSPR